MANIVITSTTNSIKIVWNNQAEQWSKECWHKSSAHFCLEKNNLFIQAIEDNGTSIALSFDGATGTKQVDSVDGVEPTSNSDLYDKLIALIS